LGKADQQQENQRLLHAHIVAQPENVD